MMQEADGAGQGSSFALALERKQLKPLKPGFLPQGHKQWDVWVEPAKLIQEVFSMQGSPLDRIQGDVVKHKVRSFLASLTRIHCPYLLTD